MRTIRISGVCWLFYCVVACSSESNVTLRLKAGGSVSGKLLSVAPATATICTDHGTVTVTVNDITADDRLLLPEKVSGPYRYAREMKHLATETGKLYEDLLSACSNYVVEARASANRRVQIERDRAELESQTARGGVQQDGTVRVVDLGVRLTDSSLGSDYVSGSWKAVVRNGTSSGESRNIEIRFMDKEGFLLHSCMEYSERFPANHDTVLTGNFMMKRSIWDESKTYDSVLTE